MDDEIDTETVRDLLAGDEDVRVVDIRSPEAFQRGHIPGSENLPFAELPERIASLEGVKRIVAVCPHGEASVQAARLIKSYEGTEDARVESMAGGLAAWDGDLERSDDENDESADETVDAADATDAPF